MADEVRVTSYDDLMHIVTGIFAGHGVPEPDASRVAECLVEADLRGVHSHGVGRVPIYTKRLRDKLVNPTPLIAVTDATLVAVHLDGDNGMGFVVGTKAMSEAVGRARTHGVGMAWASKSNHFGMAANYLLQATNSGMAAIVLTNASPAMPIWGGCAPFLGTNPFAMAVPGGSTPLVLDMATSVTARGKIRRAAQLGEDIPAGWALDDKGRPTTNAEAAYQGVVLPLGGPKGSGLSLMIDAVAGVMSGAAFGGDVGNQYTDFARPQNVGHFFLAFRPDLFLLGQDYSSRIDSLVDRARREPRAEGFDEVLMPGEPEARMAESRRKNGILMSQRDLEMLAQEAAAGASPRT